MDRQETCGSRLKTTGLDGDWEQPRGIAFQNLLIRDTVSPVDRQDLS